MLTEERVPLRERRRRSTSLEISEVSSELFLRQGVAGTTVGEIAATVGISTRTFHRYFATKADALGPVLEQGLVQYLEAVAAIPPGPRPVDDLAGELVEALVGRFTARDGELVRLVAGTPELLAVWLRMHEECAIGLVPLLADRLPGSWDAVGLRIAATVVVTANRLAVEGWAAGGDDIRPRLDHCRALLRALSG